MTQRRAVIITGASRGIGAETARTFAKAGCNVTLAARTRSDLEVVANDVHACGVESLVAVGDLADMGFVESLVPATVERWGNVDVLVNNAAWRTLETMNSISLEDWEKTLRICLTTPAFLARSAARQMELQGSGGVIVNLSSITSQRVSPGGPAYIASKGGLDSLTYALASEYGPKGIRVVGIRPGAIATEMSSDFVTPDGESLTNVLQAYSEDHTPLGRWGRPAEIAKAVVWVASSDATYLTGTTITIDGGWTPQLYPYSILKKQFPGEFE